jgi:acyl-coenzyme A thioesterase PaaI-like protein
MGAALFSFVGEDELFLTIETSICYFKAVSSGTLNCESKLVHKVKGLL